MSRDRTRVLSGLEGWRPRTVASRMRHTGLPLVLVDSASSHTIVTHTHPNIAASLRPLTPSSLIPQHTPPFLDRLPFTPHRPAEMDIYLASDGGIVKVEHALSDYDS